MIAQFLEIVGWVFVGVFPIANPLTTAPIFVALSSRYDPQQRKQLALLACLFMTGILLVFLVGGALIMTFFGITIEGIRIAGGIVIGAIGMRMLFPRSNGPSPVDQAPPAPIVSLAVSPLAMPMLSGPGSIAVILGISADIAEQPALSAQVAGYVAAAVGVVLVALVSWMTLRGSASVVRFIGEAGIDAITRIFGFLLIAVAVQFVEDGLRGFLSS